jgi:hypothetical protein
MFERYGAKPERSRIVSIDWMATAANQKMLGKRRIVLLSCRHRVITSNTTYVNCERCARLMLEGMDYDGWLNGYLQGYDGMIWPADPLRMLNEKTDLLGNFIDDPNHIPRC